MGVGVDFGRVRRSAKGASLPSQPLPGPFSNGPYGFRPLLFAGGFRATDRVVVYGQSFGGLEFSRLGGHPPRSRFACPRPLRFAKGAILSPPTYPWIPAFAGMRGEVSFTLGGFAWSASAASSGGFGSVPGGVFEGVFELSLRSALFAYAGGFGSVGGSDLPVAVGAFELTGSEFFFFGDLLIGLCVCVCFRVCFRFGASARACLLSSHGVTLGFVWVCATMSLSRRRCHLSEIRVVGEVVMWRARGAPLQLRL